MFGEISHDVLGSLFLLFYDVSQSSPVAKTKRPLFLVSWFRFLKRDVGLFLGSSQREYPYLVLVDRNSTVLRTYLLLLVFVF